MRRFTACLAVLGLLLALIWPPGAGAQTPASEVAGEAAEAWLDDLMARMSPADKVGQLFLVTFEGNDVGATSEAADLIQKLRVGGVILSPQDENFANGSSAPQQVLSLATSLQNLAFSASGPVTVTQTVPVTFTAPVEPEAEPTEAAPQVLSTVVTLTHVITYPAQQIPLFVAVSQEGDGYPFSALRSGFTELPSDMALGATWDPSNAEAVGRIAGQELAAVGANLLLGPSLDVLTQPRAGLSDYLGTRVFGGDPYWTGQMGKAYVRGVHLGSGGAVATVAMHLPGLGASDRSLEEEVATVDKSLQDLRAIDLPPFFAVTQTDAVTDTTDALLSAHIRYRGFQGNIRYVTPPISLNAQGMDAIMSQPELATWREGGGVLVSDSLGVPAIRRYFSPQLTTFPNRQIALDAFQAGNDLLTLSRFSLDDSWDTQMKNIEDTILFFRGRYEADTAFRARVDQSVRRILQLKRRLCPEFTLAGCSPSGAGLAGVGRATGTVGQIAQQAVTLLYPSSDELALRMPRPPRMDENIVIFTDARRSRDCPTCPPFYLLDPAILRNTMLQLYGPDATGQVTASQIASYSFADLQSYLASGSPDLTRSLRDADWIIFAMLDYAPVDDPSSSALRQFLKERATSPEQQKLIVLAYESPYYLDTTEVSKLTAYFGVYSKIQPFVEASVRALFLDFYPTGRSPITVEGIGYDLVRQLSPNPDQIIDVLPLEQPHPVQGTPEPLSLKVGDSLDVQTSVILDRNGERVPDGTPVVFHYVYQGEGLGGQKDATTLQGIATTTIILEREGELQISATAEPARNSRPLVVRLSGGTTQILTPTPAPTATPTPTPTPTFTPTPTPSATPAPSPTASQAGSSTQPRPPQPRVRLIDLVLALFGIVVAGAIVYGVAQKVRNEDQFSRPSLRLALWSAVCGLLGYLFYGLALPGSGFLQGLVPGLRGLLIGLVCGLLPLAAVVWQVRQARRAQ